MPTDSTSTSPIATDAVSPSDETVADVPASMGVHDEPAPAPTTEGKQEEEEKQPWPPALALFAWILGLTFLFLVFVGAAIRTSEPGAAGSAAFTVAFFALFALFVLLLAPGTLALAHQKRFARTTAHVHGILLLDHLSLEEIGKLHSAQFEQVSELLDAQTQALRETVLIMRRMETAAVMREAAQSKTTRRTGATSATKPKEDDHVLRGNTGHRLEAVTIDAAAAHRPTAPTAVVSVATIAVAATPAPRPTSSD